MLNSSIIGFLFLLIIWIGFTGRLDWQFLLVGSIISAIAITIFGDKFKWITGKISFKSMFSKILLSIPFTLVFFGQAFQSGWQVAVHALTPEVNVKPGIVKISTDLKTMAGITVLSYLITLTPGTLTVDYDSTNRCYYVHWLNVTTNDEQERKRKVVGNMEKWVGRVIE